MPGSFSVTKPDPDVTQALQALGKRRLVLAIHDASFPGSPGADPGRGTPYSAAADDFVRWLRGLGFDGLMLGPQGMTSRDNPSPYDGTLFSRNTLNIDHAGLAQDPVWGGIVGVSGRARTAPDGGFERVRHAAVFDASKAALAGVHAALADARTRGDPGAAAADRALAAFRDLHRDWLEPDALYFALAGHHGGRHQRDWPSALECRLMRPRPGEEAAAGARRRQLRRELAGAIERHALGQLLVHRQHAAWRARLAHHGLELYGDLQVGFSPCDDWQRAPLCLDGYRMGAPPSRTNPEGQPWGYRVYDPRRYRDTGGAPGPVLRFLEARVAKMLDEFDGLRIDHPHGLVCPWVYRDDDPDPFHAVRAGARLFASPSLADHPPLAEFAIPRPGQLDAGAARHADGWVRALDDAQVSRYGILLDAVVDAVKARGGGTDEVVCEVLSTCPYPLARVMARHGLGRFRVTQKANVHDPRDVYRSENAKREDWIMVGNHDTAPLWPLARGWAGTQAGHEQAQYLASRLCPDGAAERMAGRLAGDHRLLAAAKFADVFASPCAHVLVFFADLLGLDSQYNRPGTVSEENWSLRVPADYARRHAGEAARGEALHLPRVLAMAIRARGRGFAEAHRDLLARLDSRAGALDVDAAARAPE